MTDAERAKLLFQYIVEKTNKVAIGPLEYCGNAIVLRTPHGQMYVAFYEKDFVLIRFSSRVLAVRADPAVSRYYSQMVLKGSYRRTILKRGQRKWGMTKRQIMVQALTLQSYEDAIINETDTDTTTDAANSEFAAIPPPSPSLASLATTDDEEGISVSSGMEDDILPPPSIKKRRRSADQHLALGYLGQFPTSPEKDVQSMQRRPRRRRRFIEESDDD